MSTISVKAGTGLDTSSPVAFFTQTANLFLRTSGCNFGATNIPVFDGTNFVYTPAINRLLQLAANIYDATTNRAFSDGTSPNGPFYPSVFRPTFGRNGNVVYINGFVEEGDGTASYQAIPLSLPQDLALVGPNTTNIYGVPWIIGARKGFPNFNEFSLESVIQVARQLEFVKPGTNVPGATWQTNVLYTIGISNVVAVEAWNSYSSNYSRAVDIIAVDNLQTSLTNEYGIRIFSSMTSASPATVLLSNTWPGFTNSGTAAPSFVIPLFFNNVFLPDSAYQLNPPAFLPAGMAAFQTNNSFIPPHFVLEITNRLRFIMLDHATGRVIDYVHFDRATVSCDLMAALMASDPSPTTMWDTNFISANEPTNGVIAGIFNQYRVSTGALQVPVSYWASSPGGSSPAVIQMAINAFDAFLVGTTQNTVMLAPFIAASKFAYYQTWQASDPLVHYTVDDLVNARSSFPFIQLVIPSTNSVRPPNLGLINVRYNPWGVTQLPPLQTKNPAMQDPLITRSDDWNFPTGQPLAFSWLGGVHRGTPWQTFYLKSGGVDPTNWRLWTGNLNATDALLSQPANDWALAAALSTVLNTNNPHQLLSINASETPRWSSVFQGLTVLTNAPGGLAPLVVDSNINSAALGSIVADINNYRASYFGGVFTNPGQILATPSLSVSSPFIDHNNNTNELNDAAYESIPSQLLPRLRIDSIGSPVAQSSPGQFQFTGIDGVPYVVESTTNFRDWATIATLYPTNGSFLFVDPTGPADGRRFYRSVLAP